jgi:hypothetical protein
MSGKRIPSHLYAEATKDRKFSKNDENKIEELMQKVLQLLSIEKFPIEVDLREIIGQNVIPYPEIIYKEVENELTSVGYAITYKIKETIKYVHKIMIITNPRCANSSKPPPYDEKEN